MSQSLIHLIRHMISVAGPLSVEAYWNLCLSHPQFGYYATRDPFGARGDFVTAPEISQLFGEMIGVWAAEKWHSMGRPARFHLVECGPGRGTLMADVLRIGKIVPGFCDSMTIHLVETSPKLRQIQKETLPDFKPVWHDGLDSLPSDAPLIVVGNEFLDALPIRQFVYQDQQWFERLVGHSSVNEIALEWGLSKAACQPPFLPRSDIPLQQGTVLEYAPAREAVLSDLAGRIRQQGGAAVMIDYGYVSSAYGETLQAVKNHAYADVLNDCGNVDLTSHVDFDRLGACALAKGCQSRVSTQAAFLNGLGIQARAEQLSVKSHAVADGLHRLVSADAMGELFKVLEITA